jgi:glyoxylase-like metal-dependent hydrolase (beta-lactamase superfamily II)
MQRFPSLRNGLLLAGALLLPCLAGASAPMQKTQAPGYYRMMLGDFEITALNDGTVMLPMDKLLSHGNAPKVQKAFADAFLKPPIETSFNGFLINTGDKLVLVDTGAGKLFGPTLGGLLDSLKAAGYQPEQVDEVYITHFHPDHVGGLMANGQRVFPNAMLRADRREAAQWLTQAHMDAAPEDSKGFFKGAMDSVNPYVAAGKFSPFDGDTELVPGVRAKASYGHTSGHTTYIVESKGQQLALLGDLMHAAAVQFPDPLVTIAFDTDFKAASAERRIAFADAAKKGYWIAGAHLSFPGIGHLRASGSGYVFVPANYTSLKNN